MTDHDDLPTEAVPRWADPPSSPRRPADPNDVWSMSAPGAEPGAGGSIPSPEPTRVMPVTPQPPAAGAPPPSGPPNQPPVPAMDPGDEQPPRRGGWLVAGIITAVVVLLGVLAAVLLLRNDDDTVTDVTTTTGVPVTTEAPVTTTEIPVTTTEAPVTTTTEAPVTTTTEAPVTTPPPTTEAPSTWPAGLRLYVAAPDGVHAVQDDASDIIAAQQVAIAFPLPGGDLLVQDRSGRFDRGGGGSVAPGATTIRRIGSGGESVFLAPVGEQWLRLHDVGTVDGTPVALISIRTGSTIEDEEEELRVVPLSGGAPRIIGIIAGWESGTDRLHLGGRGIVGEFFAEGSSGPLLIDVDGNQFVDPAVLGLQGDYFDCGRECPHHFAIDPSGAAIGWLEDRALVVVSAANGQRLADIQVPADVSELATELELVNGVAIISRRTDGWSGPAITAVVVDLGTGRLTPISVPGIVTAVR